MAGKTRPRRPPGLPVDENPETLRHQPGAGGAAQHDAIDERLTPPAGRGEALRRLTQPFRAERLDEAHASLRPEVEIAEHGKGLVRLLAGGDPAGDHLELG